jgi:hypothetical protein
MGQPAQTLGMYPPNLDPETRRVTYKILNVKLVGEVYVTNQIFHCPILFCRYHGVFAVPVLWSTSKQGK